MGKYQIENFAYKGKYREYCWNPLNNPNATIENGMANCTTLAIAFSYILKNPYPVTRITSANNWHRVLTNGWSYELYGATDIKVGDIIEWEDKVHVATVIGFQEGEPLLGCSWYTGEHGVSIYEGSYDTRHFVSLEALSDSMIENYPFRFYHECSLYEESQRVGGMPQYVLKAPNKIDPVDEDTSKNQIHVLTDEQNIRDNDNNIIGIAQSGFYDVYGTKQSNGYTWYQIGENSYIAGVNGRVVYIPKKDDTEELKKEIEILKAKLEKIRGILDD